jgi:hypothetical protein
VAADLSRVVAGEGGGGDLVAPALAKDHGPRAAALAGEAAPTFQQVATVVLAGVLVVRAARRRRASTAAGELCHRLSLQI